MTVEQLLATPKGAPACEQRCGAPATVYAIDPMPGGWGGRYCEACAKALRFRVTDQLTTTRSTR